MLTDLAERLGRRAVGGNPHQFLEFFAGAKLVTLTAFEPDPATHRDDYYYNTITNRLYKKVVTAVLDNGVIRAHWQAVSN